MADILAGSSGHSNFAPLSKEQTVKICQHLTDQITQLQTQVRDLKVASSQFGEITTNLRTSFESQAVETREMKEDLLKTNNLLEGARNDIGRVKVSAAKLQEGCEESNESIDSLREAQKLTTTHIQKMTGDVAANSDVMNALRTDIEQRIGTNFEKLKDQVGRLELKLAQLVEYDEIDKTTAQEQREQLRKQETALRNLGDDLTETNTVVHLMEQQVGQKSTGLKGALADIEATNHSLAKLREDHENTKTDMRECRDGVKKTSTMISLTSNTLDETRQDLHNMSNSLNDKVSFFDSTRQAWDQMQSDIKSLKEREAMTGQTIKRIQSNLADTAYTATQTKAALNETQALVMPNLQMDLVGLGMTGGGAQTARGGGAGRPDTKPGLIRRVGAQGAAAELNSMAWI